jgi:AcrR family transcriptional regulator
MGAVEEILDAAGELFTTNGYSSTSTRRIAESAGIQQASIYHHFSTKQAILMTLLLTTVESPLAVAQRLLVEKRPASVRLHALIQFDAAQLFDSRWNLGALYLLPEVRGEAFEDFQTARTDLRNAYAALTDQAMKEGEGASPTAFLREVPFRLVETAINMRTDSGFVASSLSIEFADIALRAIGVAPLTEEEKEEATSLAERGA